MEHDRSCCPVQLTAAIVRGNTELRVRINEEMSCVCVELNGAPYPVLLAVTPTGAENLRTAIAAGIAALAARQSSTVNQAAADE